VEHVLFAQAAACITVPPAAVFQTEEGNPVGSLTSFAGYSVGNIKVVTDGVSAFTVSADGGVHQGVNELAVSGLPRTFQLDDVTTPDTTAPTTSVTSPANGATVASIHLELEHDRDHQRQPYDHHERVRCRGEYGGVRTGHGDGIERSRHDAAIGTYGAYRHRDDRYTHAELGGVHGQRGRHGLPDLAGDERLRSVHADRDVDVHDLCGHGAAAKREALLLREGVRRGGERLRGIGDEERSREIEDL
jgi:hypothetical protein